MRYETRFTARKIAHRLQLIAPLVYRRWLALPPFTSDAGVSIAAGDHWIGPNEEFTLRTEFSVPSEWGREALALLLPLGEAGDFSHPEALIYVDETPLTACDRHHQERSLPARYADGSSHHLTVRGWSGNLAGDPHRRLLMRECALVQVDRPTREFIALARVALGTADALDDHDPARAHLYAALEEAFARLSLREFPDAPQSSRIAVSSGGQEWGADAGLNHAPLTSPQGREQFYADLPAALSRLRERIQHAGPPLDVSLFAIGHAHLDVAWLWPLRRTRRKAIHTFHNALSLMAREATFHFGQSQPQLYDFVRQDDPALFAEVQQKAREGRWELLGPTWVEMDCQLSGPEPLARQFLLGMDFFRQHFDGVPIAPVLWLPDAFGFSWNLPQLIKEAGLQYFFTAKLGWNQHNRLPYDTFWWQGLDGTKVLTHFDITPYGGAYVGTYNSDASPAQVLGTWRTFQQKDAGKPGLIPPLLLVYGYGDGGGGPTREMVEMLHLLRSFPAQPRVQLGRVSDFFRHLEDAVGEHLPTWNDELYLENHRGTYTTQGRIKQANRRAEFWLHDAEFLATAARLIAPSYQYPREELHRAWELVALNQFHDILPGSSIGAVYEEALQQYAEVRTCAFRVRDEALAVLAQHVGGSLLLVNPTSFSRHEPVFLAHADCPTDHVCQPVADGVLVDVGELPPYSVTPLSLTPSLRPDVPASARMSPLPVLENAFLRVEFNQAGDIARIYDKQAAREVIPPRTPANQFQAFEDRPLNPDAWDVDIFFEDKRWLAEPATSLRVIESGPLRATLEIHRRILSSDIVQRISLTHTGPRLDFATTVQWRERHILLKVAFPVDILAPQATYEIPWGNIERPTHRNTSWDWAKFEVPAQKWVDLSEGGYGVSLLNDGKYGHDIHDNVIRLSLLRSPTTPDPHADEGEHHFTYSLLPHLGPWDERTLAAAYALNDPLIVHRVAHPVPPRAPLSFFRAAAPNVIIETVKLAEEGQDIVLRLYESRRRRGRVILTTGFPLREAVRTNLLEEDREPLACDEQSRVSFFIKPYQIITLRLKPEAERFPH